MKQTYKWLILLISVVMILSCFAGCKGDGDTETPTTPVGGDLGGGTTDPATPSVPGVDQVALPTEKYNDDIVIAMVNDGWYVRDIYIEEYYDQNMAIEELSSVVDKAVIERNNIVCDTYGVDIKLVLANDGMGLEPFMTILQSGSDEYDIIAPAGRQGIEYALSGYAVDWNTEPVLNTYFEWWNQSARECFTINDKLFFMSGDLSHGATASSYALLANKTEIENYGAEVPYDDVANGDWTFEDLKTLSLDCAGDLDGDGAYTLGIDRIGLIFPGGGIYAPFYASGCMAYSTRDKNGFCELTMSSETAYNAMDEFFKLLANEKCALRTPYVNNAEEMKGITEGKFIFYSNTIQAFVKNFADVSYDLAFLPFPKMDSTQDGYTSHMTGSCTVFLIPKTVKDPTRSAVIMEALSQIGNKRVIPEYFGNVVSLRAMKTEENYNMLQIINGARLYDLGYFTRAAERLLMPLAEEGSADEFYSTYEKIFEAEEAYLLEIYEAYSN